MFEIEYKGGNTVVISTKKSKLITDPRQSVLGLKDQSVRDAVSLATESRLQSVDSDARLAIEGPGEYEVVDFSIQGAAATRHIDTEDVEKKATIYRIEIGDARIALVGNIAPKLGESQLESLGVVDVLVIPVGGGGYTLDATAASVMTRAIDPKVVIPVHYSDSSLSYEVPQDDLSVFVAELGVSVETTSKYKIKSLANLPPTLTIVELTRS